MRRNIENDERGSFEHRSRFLSDLMRGDRQISEICSSHGIDQAIARRWQSLASRGIVPIDAIRLEHAELSHRFAQLQSPQEVAFRLCESIEVVQWHFDRFERINPCQNKEWELAPLSRAHERYQARCREYAEWRAERRQARNAKRKKKEREAAQKTLTRKVVLDDGAVARPIPGLPGYAATTDGRIVSVRKGNRLLVPRVNEKGFSRVKLWRDGKEIQKSVHILVWGAFNGERKNGRIVFLDEEKTNCRLSNLRLVSQSDHFAIRPAHRKSNKLTDDDVRAIRDLRGKMKQRDIAEQFGVRDSTVSRIQTGKRRRRLELA